MQSQHIVRSFDEDLKYLANRIAAMGGHAERMVDQAVAALVNSDAALARKVVEDDAFLDDGQREIDDKAILVIAKRQPMADDLREMIGAIRISADLERVGDLGKNIAKRVVAVSEARASVQPVPRPAGAGRTGADPAQGRARRLCVAFGRPARLRARPRRPDRRHVHVALPRTLTYMMEDPRNISALHASAVLRQEYRAHRRPCDQHRRDDLLRRSPARRCRRIGRRKTRATRSWSAWRESTEHSKARPEWLEVHRNSARN